MSGLLLDTHVFFWWCTDDQRLTSGIRRVIQETSQAVYVSAVTAWEIALKQRLGKVSLPPDVAADPANGIARTLEAARFKPLAVSFGHAERVKTIPLHHRDPFDHLLIAQAQVEGLTVVSNDPAFGLYHVPTLWT